MQQLPDNLISAYMEGTLDEVQSAELSRWVLASKDNARYLASLAKLEHSLVKHTKMQSNRDILTELAELEADAQADTVTLVGQVDAPATKVSARDYAYAGRYIFEHALASKRLLYTAGSAVAAVLLVALTLVFALSGGQNEPVIDPLANAPLWDTPTSKVQPIVATLTDSVGAQWQSDDKPVSMAMGTQLAAFQRFTLTHGFAEITTRRGAVAVLEAPATIELVENDNAIRLHAGKLVGICQTRLSKGFNVLTPGAQVIDIGTEFGVEVTGRGETKIVVFDGRVALAEPGIAPETARLTEVTAGEARRVDTAGNVQEMDPSSFEDTFVRSVDPGTRYEVMVLADKPLIYYRMDQVIGGVERNFAADRYHATIHGDVTAAIQGRRSSFSLGSFGDYLQTAEPIKELRAAPTYTIECWVKPRQYDFGSICMIGNTQESSTVGVSTAARLELTDARGQIGPSQRVRIVHLSKNQSNGVELTRDDFNELYSNKAHALDRWMHVAAVKDGETLSLYINGSKVEETQTNVPLLDQEQQITIGRFSTAATEYPAHTRQFLGELDELAVYDHALSPEAIRERHEAGQSWLVND